METNMDFINMAPIHRYVLKQRMLDIVQLRDHIMTTQKTFKEYSKVGSSLCQCMEQLSDTFVKFSQFDTDPALNSIRLILNQFTQTLNMHFSQIDDIVITPLQRFVNDYINVAEHNGTVAETAYQNYMKNVDQLAATNKKKTAELEDLQNKVASTHETAVLADFAFSRSLEIVERKKILELTGTFCQFIHLMHITYKECVFNFEGEADSFQTLQAILPDSSKEVRTFESRTDTKRETLKATFDSYIDQKFHQPYTETKAKTLSGYLWKKGTGITRSWQRRYFVCRDFCLYYYHSAEDSSQPQGKLNLLLTTIKKVEDSERRFCFTVISQEKTYYLQALTEWDRQEWISVISNNIAYLLNHTEGGVTPAFPEEHCEDAIPESLPTSFPFNKVCADCGAESPTWCCINWGTCICIHCSGVHRELTSSVSKVRSLTLDKLDPTTLKLFEVIGNERANSILEQCVGNHKIKPNADKEERRKFIQEKYRQSAFIVENAQAINIGEAIFAKNIMDVYRAICYGQLLREQNGYCSIHTAARVGDPLITLLIALNCPNVNALDIGGWSALSYAVYYGNQEAAEILLQFGSDPTISKDAHPYLIALFKKDTALEATFKPFYSGSVPQPVPVFEPPVTQEAAITKRRQ